MNKPVIVKNSQSNALESKAVPNYSYMLERIETAINAGRIRLPSFPENLLKIKQAVNDPETSIRQLARLAHSDTVLAGKIFALANSAAYALNTDRMSLVEVMSWLGLNTIRSTVYNHCLSQLFSDRRFTQIEDTVSFVRNRSLEMAGLTYTMSRQYSIGESSLALLSGMLHNIGALYVISWLAQTSAVKLDGRGRKSLVVLGQYRLAHYVLEAWSMPESLREVILAGTPSAISASDDQSIEVPKNPYVHLVQIARWLSATMRNSRATVDVPQYSLDLLKLSEKKLKEDRDVLLNGMIKIIHTLR